MLIQSLQKHTLKWQIMVVYTGNPPLLPLIQQLFFQMMPLGFDYFCFNSQICQLKNMDCAMLCQFTQRLSSKTKTHPGIKIDTIFKSIGHERQRRGLGEYLGQPGGMGRMLMQVLQGGWVDPRFLILGGLFCFGGMMIKSFGCRVYEILHGNLLYWMI